MGVIATTAVDNGSDLQLRLPDVEWAVRSASGELDGLSWVDTRLDPELPPSRLTLQEGHEAFHQVPYIKYMPTYIADMALDAQRRGRPTAWEGLYLLFARPEWSIASRRHLWAPYSPYPGVLSKMVEAFGIERSMHRFDRGRLARLSAMLPSWYPARGRLDQAWEVLHACGELESADSLWGQSQAAPKGALVDEVMCCRGADWWRARMGEGTTPEYRITDGFVRFQPDQGAPYALRVEDFLVQLQEDGRMYLETFRLLPAWACVRVTTDDGSTYLKRKAEELAAKEAAEAEAKKKAAKKKKPAKAKAEPAKAPPKRKAKPKPKPKPKADEIEDGVTAVPEEEEIVLELGEADLEILAALEGDDDFEEEDLDDEPTVQLDEIEKGEKK